MLVVSILMIINISFGLGTSLYLLNPVLSSSLSTAFYRIRAYMLQSSAIMYRWCLVAASFDRYAISSSNIRIRNFANINITRRIILGIILIWLILPIYNFIYNTTVLQNAPDNVYISGVLYFHSIFSAITGCVLPGILMIIFAFLVHHNLVEKLKRRQINIIQLNTINNDKYKQEQKRDRQVFIILIVQTVLLIIIVLPLMINLFYNAITLNIKNKSLERLTIERFCWSITELISYLLPVLSFYLFTMTSSMFRNEFVTIIRIIIQCRCLHMNTRIEPVTNIIERQTVGEH